MRPDNIILNVQTATASGMMADLRLVPPYVREFYSDMYELLPDDAPAPASVARHN